MIKFDLSNQPLLFEKLLTRNHKRETQTHSSKTIVFSKDGNRNCREQDGKLGTKNNLLEVNKQVSEQNTANLGHKSEARLLAQGRRGHVMCSSARPRLLAQPFEVSILQQLFLLLARTHFQNMAQ